MREEFLKSFFEDSRGLENPSFVIKKGKYWGELLLDWRKDESIVGKTFQRLLRHPNLDKSGYCLEIYPNEKDIRCLVPLS